MKNPLAYFHIATFLLSGKSRNLSEYWKAEVIMRDKFVLHRLIRNGLQRQRGFLMWWRLVMRCLSLETKNKGNVR